MTQYTSITADQNGIELDEYLSQLFPGLPKRTLRWAVRTGRVRVNEQLAPPARRLGPADVITIDLELDSNDSDAIPARTVADSAKGELHILHESEHCLVIDKPAGLPVEPDRWAPDGPCLVSTLLAWSQDRSARAPFRPRIVHRIDKETSGVLLVARTLIGERALRAAFDRGLVRKRYWALVEGEVPAAPDPGRSQEPAAEPVPWRVIDGPIGPVRGPVGGSARGRQGVVPGGASARTSYRVLERFRGFTVLECEPHTGRTHQIRVHLASEGFPLAVDALYGRRKVLHLSELKPGYRHKPGMSERPLLARVALHAAELGYPDPVSGELCWVRAELPRDLRAVVRQLSKLRPWRT